MMSFSYNSHTDKQMERTHRTLEQTLRYPLSEGSLDGKPVVYLTTIGLKML